MLYVFYGGDTTTGLKKSHALIGSLRAKRPDAAFVRIEAGDWDQSLIEEHIGGQGLFSNKYIVFLDRLSESAEAKECLVDFVPDMQASPNIFIVFDGKLNVEQKKAFEKHAEKIVVCEDTVKSKEMKDGNMAGKSGFNIFALTSALDGGDPVKAWRIYREAIERGTSVENILGVLFWKAKSASSQRLSREIVVLYHEGHRGTIDLELGIERLLLRGVSR